jgi:hypothetical protein
VRCACGARRYSEYADSEEGIPDEVAQPLATLSQVLASYDALMMRRARHLLATAPH